MTPFYEEDGIVIYRGDCRDVISGLDPVDAIITDPPYHLTAGKKGGTGVASENLNSPYGRARIGTGFMGKAWDGGDVAFDPETWAIALRCAKPGAYLLAFGGTRTFHRLACAIEDAGWELRDTIMWVHGQGFPKSLNVERSIDSEICEMAGRHYWAESSLPTGDKARPDDHVCPSTDSGREHKGEGTALKPSWEPIIVARAPIDGTIAANVLQHGTGSMNIEACRIDGVDGDGHWSGDDNSDATSTPGYEGGFTRGGKVSRRLIISRSEKSTNTYGDGINGSRAAGETTVGRWPANLIHDGSDEVLAAFPNAPGQQGDLHGQSKDRKSRGIFGDMSAARESIARLDSGSAARFYYAAKASQEDRNDGCEDLETRQQDESRQEGNPGGDNPRNRGLTRRGNHHPTVKPTSLMRYLVRLVTPPDGTVLDPFAGSGSTGKACALEGVKCIQIEGELEYCEIAARRCRIAQRSLFHLEVER